jgi:hypothetical protein
VDQPITYGDYLMMTTVVPLAIGFVIFLWREIFS